MVHNSPMCLGTLSDVLILAIVSSCGNRRDGNTGYLMPFCTNPSVPLSHPLRSYDGQTYLGRAL